MCGYQLIEKLVISSSFFLNYTEKKREKILSVDWTSGAAAAVLADSSAFPSSSEGLDPSRTKRVNN